MIEIIKSPSYNFLLTQVRSSTKHIAICTPNIDENILSKVISNKNEKTSISLITSHNVAKYLFKYTNLDIINTMLDRHFKIYNFQQLNANIYIFDNKHVWITSSQLTEEGLESSFNYGVYSSDKRIVDPTIEDYKAMINSEQCGKVNKKHITFMQNQLRTLDRKNVAIDLHGDYVLTNNNVVYLSHNFHGWKKLIFETICHKINKQIFLLEDIYKFKQNFSEIYPNNHHIEEKIRQILQAFRDIGYLKFMNNKGEYKKLWK